MKRIITVLLSLLGVTLVSCVEMYGPLHVEYVPPQQSEESDEGEEESGEKGDGEEENYEDDKDNEN